MTQLATRAEQSIDELAANLTCSGASEDQATAPGENPGGAAGLEAGSGDATAPAQAPAQAPAGQQGEAIAEGTDNHGPDEEAQVRTCLD